MNEITTQALLDRILCADVEEINPILDAITERFTQVWPDWELMTISVPGHTAADHIKSLESSMRLVKHFL